MTITMVCHQNSVDCVLVGDGMIGKSCLTKRFAENQYSTEYVTTVATTSNGSVSAYGETYNINIQEVEEQNSRSLAIIDADVIALCFSTVDRVSFENIKSIWFPLVRKLNKKKPIVLVATQSDVRDENNADHVSDTEAQSLMKTIDGDYYNKCSAATSDGVTKVFESVVCSANKYRTKKSTLAKRIFGR